MNHCQSSFSDVYLWAEYEVTHSKMQKLSQNIYFYYKNVKNDYMDDKCKITRLHV